MNRHIYRLVAAALAAITIVSCNDARRSETYRLLEDVDSYIEARPDSALAVLEGSFLYLWTKAVCPVHANSCFLLLTSEIMLE